MRGYTDLLPPQQAAVAAVIERFGPAGRHDYLVTETLREGDQWRIHITGKPPQPAHIDVELHARRTPLRQLTCRAPMEGSVIVYEPTSVRRT